MKKHIILLLSVLIGHYAGAQCLTNSLIVNTGYNPITNLAIAGGANGATPVPDPYWILTAVSPATTAAIAATPGGYIAVIPGNKADIITPITGSWVAHPAGNPGNWISCLNSNTYNDQGTGLPYTQTLGRPFRMCTDDSIKININIASDNSTSAANIDGTIILPTPATGFNAYTPYTQTVWLTAGTHTLNITANNLNIASVASNPTGLDVYGTISSATGSNSLVSESYASCATYTCGNSCNTITLPDSLHLCQGSSDTLRAAVIGTDSVLSIAWTPITGLSNSSVLRPLLTVGTTSGYYDITIQSLIPYTLVNNGDFSLGNTGFSSTYTYGGTGSSAIYTEGTYSVPTNPALVHPSATSFGDHTTGTGKMLAVNGSGTPTSVWCQTIPVTPNTDYAFSAWAANWSPPGAGTTPILQFQINGILIGTALNLTSPAGTWVHFYAIWNSGVNTSASICIYDACTSLGGNDFVLDDISFQQICVSKDSIYVDVHLIDTTRTHHDTTACAPVSVTLTAPSGYSSYLWSTGSPAASIVVGAVGNYWVYAPSTCAMLIDTFHVNPGAIDTTYSHRDSSICVSAGPMTLTAPAGYTSYKWNTGSTASSLTVSTDGSYWVYATGPCVVFVDTFHVTFRTLPPPPTVRDTFYCYRFGAPASLDSQVIGSIDSLTWFFGGFQLPGVPPPPSTANVTYPTGTTWYVSQTVNGCRGDSAAVTVQIVDTPVFTITTQPWVCQFDSITLSYNGATLVDSGYTWTLPGGASVSNINSLHSPSVVVKFDSAGPNNYVYLTAYNLYGQCTSTYPTRIDVVELPTATAYSKPDVCMGDTVSLALSSKSSSAGSFIWSVDHTPLFSSGALNIISASSNSGGPFSISWVDSGNHIIYVQAVAAHGCTNKPTADSVYVHMSPDATFRSTTYGNTLCLEDSVLFSANDSSYQNSYTWAPAHFFNSPGKHAMWGKVELENSVVTLTVTDPFGCKASSNMQLSPVNCCNVLFPNAFTPNGDGNNDVFRPIPVKEYHRYHIFRVVDRWGQTVFETTNNKAEWDGNFNGVPQDIGVYYYYLKYDCGGKTLEEKGDVTLIR